MNEEEKEAFVQAFVKALTSNDREAVNGLLDDVFDKGYVQGYTMGMSVRATGSRSNY